MHIIIFVIIDLNVSPSYCSNISSLDVFTGEREGSTCHSHDITASQSQPSNQFPMVKIMSSPTFFMFKKPFHSDIRHNRESSEV